MPGFLKLIMIILAIIGIVYIIPFVFMHSGIIILFIVIGIAIGCKIRGTIAPCKSKKYTNYQRC